MLLPGSVACSEAACMEAFTASEASGWGIRSGLGDASEASRRGSKGGLEADVLICMVRCGPRSALQLRHLHVKQQPFSIGESLFGV